MLQDGVYPAWVGVDHGSVWASQAADALVISGIDDQHFWAEIVTMLEGPDDAHAPLRLNMVGLRDFTGRGCVSQLLYDAALGR